MVIGLIAAGAWISVTIVAVALCRMAGRADETTVPAADYPCIARPWARVRQPPRQRKPGLAASREAGAHVLLFPH